LINKHFKLWRTKKKKEQDF